MVYHRILNIVPCSIRRTLLFNPFYIQLASSNPKLPILPSPIPPPLWQPQVYSLCESVSIS